jgi:hypothetical protein
MFQSLFGPTSAQPSSLPSKLFGFEPVTGNNTLFTAPRELGLGGQWTVTSAVIDNHNNTDIGTNGFKAQLDITIERIQACRDRIGNPVTSVAIENGNTMYRFKLSATHVTATRKGDTSFVHYAPFCTERAYSLAVSNSIFALSGIQTNALNNAIYVQSVDYEPIGYCAAYTDCQSGLGPQHECPLSESKLNPATLRSLTYAVNLDMRSVTNQIGLVSVTSFYGLAYTEDAVVNQANCYNASTVEVRALSALGLYSESGITRTQVKFRTGCQELRTGNQSNYGAAVADAFVTCLKIQL